MMLTNIANSGRTIYLFLRNENGELEIKKDETFYPYFYEEHIDGNYNSFNGKKLKKIFVTEPKEVRNRRSVHSWESDVIFTSRYLIDKVDKLDKCPIKFSFIDMEVLCNEFPDPNKAEYPISCISSSNSYTNKITSFYLGDYESEYKMIEAFIDYLNKEKFDLFLFWNGDNFDIPYISNRVPDFSKKVSPINKVRYGQKDLYYPAGISIVDYMLLDKKFTLNRKREYSLDARLQEVIGRGKQIKKLDFGTLSLDIKQRCENDVRDMMEMEKKLQYIPMLDGIRRTSKIKFEDYYFNSRAIGSLLLTEAKKRNIILPNKPKKEDNGEDFEGAFRKVFQKGALFNCGSYDLSGAYLNAILEFSLDPSNVYDEKIEGSLPVNVTDRVSNKIIATYYIKQNIDGLLPAVAKTLLEEKNKFKELKNNTNPELPEYKEIEEKYKAWKSLALSAWGAIGDKYFRYYDYRVASMITSIVRDLLHYVIDELKKYGYEVKYVDTDGIIVDDRGKNIVGLLNSLVQQWSKLRYNKPTAISFDYEGNYERLIILAMCRYKGWLRRPDGTLEEKITGIESKRKDSTIYLKQFQTVLLDKIMNKEKKEDIIAWIKNEVKELHNKPLHEIAFPAKVANKTYKNVPIFKRALDNTEGFDKKPGSLFYWLYIKPMGEPKVETHIYVDNEIYEIIKTNKSKKEIVASYAEKNIDKSRIKVLHKKDKPCNTQAFDEGNFKHIDRNNIDWKLMENRNIYNKVEVIFGAIGWDINLVKDSEVIDLPKVKTTAKNIGDAEEVSRKKCLSSTKEGEVKVLPSAPILNKEFNRIQEEKLLNPKVKQGGK